MNSFERIFRLARESSKLEFNARKFTVERRSFGLKARYS